MAVRFVEQQAGQAVADEGVLVDLDAGGQRDFDIAVEQAQHLAAKFLGRCQSAEVGQVDGVRLERQHALDGGAHLVRVELDRARRGEDQRTAVDIELAVGNAEGVAGENAAALAVDDGDVVLRVARCVDAEQFARAEPEYRVVVGFDDAAGGDR